LLAGCSEIQETTQRQAAQEQPQSQEMLSHQTVSPSEGVAKPDLAVQELIQKDPGQAYLYINAQKTGVQVTPSGLQFEVIESGEGRSPSVTSNVVTHYHGTFVNGEVFDSSVDRGAPAEFPVNGVIAGWTEALQMMKEGDKIVQRVQKVRDRFRSEVNPSNWSLMFEPGWIAWLKRAGRCPPGLSNMVVLR
jgi:FKBP-type peptidyl-prolyl cis-trans isomerase FklB